MGKQISWLDYVGYSYNHPLLQIDTYGRPAEYTITAGEYNELLRDSMMLQALLESDVEKTFAWDDALEVFCKMEKGLK